MKSLNINTLSALQSKLYVMLQNKPTLADRSVEYRTQMVLLSNVTQLIGKVQGLRSLVENQVRRMQEDFLDGVKRDGRIGYCQITNQLSDIEQANVEIKTLGEVVTQLADALRIEIEQK